MQRYLHQLCQNPLESKELKRPSLADNTEYQSSASTLGTLSSPARERAAGEAELAEVTEESVEEGEETPVMADQQTLETYKTSRKIKVNRRIYKGKVKSKLDDVKFEHAHSILDEVDTTKSKYKGFYVMIWFSIAVTNLDFMVNHLLEHGLESDILATMGKDLTAVALTDLAMYLSMYFVVVVQKAICCGWITWHGSGWLVTSAYELAFTVFFLYLAQWKDFPWIGKIFLFLHSMVQLMKMHSYSFYNGYLWNIVEELNESRGLLKKSDTLSKEVVDHLNESVEFCQSELASQSTTTPFPGNLTWGNFFQFTMFPTVVYQIDYPRTPRIRPHYLFKKLAAVFGVIMLMIVVAQTTLHPIAMRAISLRSLPLKERLCHYPLLLLDIVPSFFLIYILDFYLIWDAILNAIAELTRFADRDFYGDWWNCTSWYEFSKLWNKPVHNFLLRHVYHSSLSAFQLNKQQTTLLTFLLSSVIHELAMFVIFHKLRGYLLIFQMLQLPLIYLHKLPFMKDKDTLNNALFWAGIATGPSIMCTLYLTF